jgi:hypothetical protein
MLLIVYRILLLQVRSPRETLRLDAVARTVMEIIRISRMAGTCHNSGPKRVDLGKGVTIVWDKQALATITQVVSLERTKGLLQSKKGKNEAADSQSHRRRSEIGGPRGSTFVLRLRERHRKACFGEARPRGVVGRDRKHPKKEACGFGEIFLEED